MRNRVVLQDGLIETPIPLPSPWEALEGLDALVENMPPIAIGTAKVYGVQLIALIQGWSLSQL